MRGTPVHAPCHGAVTEMAGAGRAPSPLGCVVLRNGLRYVVAGDDADSAVEATCGDDAGVWLCIVLTGELLVHGAGRCIAVQPGTLRVVDFEVIERRWTRREASNLGVAIFLPDGWCAACPCGGQCPVLRLRHDDTISTAAGEPATVRLDDDAAALARALIDAVADGHVLHHEATILRLLSWVQQVTSTAARAALPIRPDVAGKIYRAAAIIERRYDSPPTITELARLAAINECDLKRLFKVIFGQSIGRYSRIKRLEAARDLLIHGSLNITDVALEVGFHNPSRFATAFRNHFGRNPADYRREHAGAK